MNFHWSCFFLSKLSSAPLLACSFANDFGDCRDPDADSKMAYCCDGGGWKMVYQLDIEDDANYDEPSDIPYTIDNSESISDGSFRRVGIHLQLDDEWVFISMDAYTDQAGLIGLPIDWIHDHTFVSNIHIQSNSQSLDEYNGMISAEGIIEMWSNCYGTSQSSMTGTVLHDSRRRNRRRLDYASDFQSTDYDHDDTISSSKDCYGSFQVHAADGSTLLAYNGWSYGGSSTITR